MTTTHTASPLTIGHRRAANRIAVLPVECNDGDACGAPTGRTLQRYRDFAAGEAGMIFVESLSISPESRSRVNQLQITEQSAAGLSHLVQGIREVNPQALVLFQLSHSGRLTDPNFASPVSVYPAEELNIPVLSAKQIEEVGAQFVQAAIIAREVGADGIDFKQAHGIFTAELLRPANRRADRYGGSFANRTRFFRETVRQIKQGVDDPSFIVGARFSVYEGIPGGFGTAGPEEVAEDLLEAVAFAEMAEQEGLDFVSVSAGEMGSTSQLISPPRICPDLIYRHFGWVARIRQAVSIPVVGACYSGLKNGKNDLPGADPGQKSMTYWAEKNLREGNVDLVGFGRQALADPAFPAKILAGRESDVRWCTNCGGCGLLVGAQKEAGCVIHSTYYRDLFRRLKLVTKA